jgi:hypothetical protein
MPINGQIIVLLAVAVHAFLSKNLVRRLRNEVAILSCWPAQTCALADAPRSSLDVPTTTIPTVMKYNVGKKHRVMRVFISIVRE